MTVLFSPEAEEDFRIAVAYLTTRNPSAARALAERIFAAVDQLCDGSFEVLAPTLHGLSDISTLFLRRIREGTAAATRR